MKYRKDRIELDDEAIGLMYSEGNSENQISKFLSVSRQVVRRRLKRLGIIIRNRSEAEYNKWNHMNEFQRQNQVQKVKMSLIGEIKSEKELLKRANKLQNTTSRKGHFENECKDRLSKLGIACNEQTAVNKYNLDLSFNNFAIEIHINSHNPLTSHRYKERLNYLLNQGWNVIYIRNRKLKNAILSDKAIENVYNFIIKNENETKLTYSINFDGSEN